MNHQNIKFRPVLSLEQISYIANLCNASLSCGDVSGVHDPILSASVRKVLIPMIAKIEIGAISPAYTLSPEQIARQKEKSDRERYENDMMDPEEMLSYENKLLGV